MSSTKKFVLSNYDKFQNLIKNDVDAKELYIKIIKLKNSIKCEKNGKKFNDLNNELKDIETLFCNKMKTELTDFYIRYPKLFDMVIENNTPRAVFENVLAHFEKFNKHEISEYEAVENGIDFSNSFYNLPEGFLDKKNVDMFIKNKNNEEEEG